MKTILQIMIMHQMFSLLGTDNVRGQISEHILAPNGCRVLFVNYLLEMPLQVRKSAHAKSFVYFFLVLL